MERQAFRSELVIAAILLAIGLVVGGYLMGNGLVRARHADRAVTMRGLAERDVTADLATWTLAYSATGSDVVSVQQQTDRATGIILAMLAKAGFSRDEINVAGVNVSQYQRNDGGLNVTSRQRLQLRTTKVMAARRAFADQAALVRQGVALEDGSGIAYSFTKLNEIKPAMIAEATKDARKAAEQFAKDSGTSVGAIRQATQGYFSIGARDGESGGSGSESPFQKVRVVTTIDFYLD
ncbi:SIMPL domain-containing protein [Sphingomonas sp. 1P06PA]|uniref:SIMPL domain-containing protein n=1 Tax=Sphingomonas sp. 1P06PA TaxID=554121 RepID=UPI0039A532E9